MRILRAIVKGLHGLFAGTVGCVFFLIVLGCLFFADIAVLWLGLRLFGLPAPTDPAQLGELLAVAGIVLFIGVGVSGLVLGVLYLPIGFLLQLLDERRQRLRAPEYEKLVQRAAEEDDWLIVGMAAFTAAIGRSPTGEEAYRYITAFTFKASP